MPRPCEVLVRFDVRGELIPDLINLRSSQELPNAYRSVRSVDLRCDRIDTAGFELVEMHADRLAAVDSLSRGPPVYIAIKLVMWFPLFQRKSRYRSGRTVLGPGRSFAVEERGPVKTFSTDKESTRSAVW